MKNWFFLKNNKLIINFIKTEFKKTVWSLFINKFIIMFHIYQFNLNIYSSTK